MERNSTHGGAHPLQVTNQKVIRVVDFETVTERRSSSWQSWKSSGPAAPASTGIVKRPRPPTLQNQHGCELLEGQKLQHSLQKCWGNLLCHSSALELVSSSIQKHNSKLILTIHLHDAGIAADSVAVWSILWGWNVLPGATIWRVLEEGWKDQEQIILLLFRVSWC